MKRSNNLVLYIITGLLLGSCSTYPHKQNQQTQEPIFKNNKFITSDGSALPYAMWGPHIDPSVIIVGMHSFGDFSKTYELIGKYFAKQKIAVWTYDQRGFGDSPNRGIWAGTETLVQDMRQFATLVQQEAGNNIPMVFLGESMGAAVILAALGNDNLDIKPKSIILSGPAVRENRPYRYLFNIGLWGITRIIPGKEAKIARTFDKQLDPFHAERWASDLRIIDSVRLDTYYGLIRLSDYASEKAKELRVPTLVLFGTDDSQIHPKSICALMSALNSESKLQVYDKNPHLMFQVKNQEDILLDISAWVIQQEYLDKHPKTALCNHTK